MAQCERCRGTCWRNHCVVQGKEKLWRSPLTFSELLGGEQTRAAGLLPCKQPWYPWANSQSRDLPKAEKFTRRLLSVAWTQQARPPQRADFIMPQSFLYNEPACWQISEPRLPPPAEEGGEGRNTLFENPRNKIILQTQPCQDFSNRSRRQTARF